MENEPYLAIQVVMMPKDANTLPPLPGSEQNFTHLTIFGGVILSYVDQAGAIGARREVMRRGAPPPILVSVAMNKVEFKKPVFVGDVVRFLTRVVRIGRTSIAVHVAVEALRGEQILQVTEAEAIYVAIDRTSPDRRPIPLLPEGSPSAPR